MENSLKISILNQTNEKDFEGLINLLKKFIIDIYVRNKPEYMHLRASKKFDLINKSILEYNGLAPLSILTKQDILSINKRLDFQIKLAKREIQKSKDNDSETRYYILKDKNEVVAFQQAKIMKVSELNNITGWRYLAYTSPNYAKLGKQHIVDSQNNTHFDLCSEVLYLDISNWFKENGVMFEKTSTGRNMLSNILTYIVLLGFLPQSKDDRNIYFEKDISRSIPDSTLKTIYKLYAANIKRTKSVDFSTLSETLSNIPQLDCLDANQKKGIARCLLTDEEMKLDTPNERMTHLNCTVKESINHMSPGKNYDLIYDIASRMVTELPIVTLETPPFPQIAQNFHTKNIALDFFTYLDKDLSKQLKEKIEKNSINCTGKIENIYLFVRHLITNVFQKSQNLNLFEEFFPACLETILTIFLLENHYIDTQTATIIEKKQITTRLKSCMETLSKLELINIIQQHGIIEFHDLERLQRQYNLSNKQFVDILEKVTSSSSNINTSINNTVAQLLLPYSIQKFKNNPSEFIKCFKRCLEKSQKNDFRGILSELGITQLSSPISTLIKENKTYISSMDTLDEKEL